MVSVLGGLLHYLVNCMQVVLRVCGHVVHVKMDAEKDCLWNNPTESFKIQISVEYQKCV